MKSQKIKTILTATALMVAFGACNNTLQDKVASCNAGDPTKGADYQKGVDLGTSDNNAAKAAGQTDGTAAGQALTPAQGQTDGYNQGYNDGYKASYATAYKSSYNDNYGYPAGVYQGNQDAPYLYSQGQTNGYNKGLSDGQYYGASAGQSDGYSDGYDQGYSDGQSDGTSSCSSSNVTSAVAHAYTAKSTGVHANSDPGSTFVSQQSECYNTGYKITYDPNLYTTTFNTYYGTARTANIPYMNAYNLSYQPGVTAGQPVGLKAGILAGEKDGYTDGYNSVTAGVYDNAYSASYNNEYAQAYSYYYNSEYTYYYHNGYNDGYDDGYDSISCSAVAASAHYARDNIGASFTSKVTFSVLKIAKGTTDMALLGKLSRIDAVGPAMEVSANKKKNDDARKDLQSSQKTVERATHDLTKTLFKF